MAIESIPTDRVKFMAGRTTNVSAKRGEETKIDVAACWDV